VIRAAHLAALWAFAFAAVSLYWVLGGEAGADTLSRGLEKKIRMGEDTLVYGVVPGIGKLGLGVLALLLARAEPRRIEIVAGWGAGALLALYGAASTAEKALMKAGAINTPDSLAGDRVGWYLFFWDPLWLLGGVLFLLAARAASPQSA